MIKYHHDLCDTLLKYGFNSFNIKELSNDIEQRGSGLTRFSNPENNQNHILNDMIQLLNIKCDEACIFTLPGNRRDGKHNLYYINCNKEKFLRMIELRAFL